MAWTGGKFAANVKLTPRAVSITLALLFTLIATTPTAAQTGSPSSYRDALIALYNATDGPNRINNANWLSDEPLGTWYGVATDDIGLVSELSLSENRLSRQIPMALGTLSNLALLHLDGNRLTGQVPTELGRLSNLAVLRLYGNQLSGALCHVLTELSALTELYFDDNAGLCASADDAFRQWMNGFGSTSVTSVRSTRPRSALPPAR